MDVRTKKCGAPGCLRPTAKAEGKAGRSINGIPVCRPCYQRAWEYAKDHGIAIRDVNLAKLPAAQLDPPATASTCAREGCDVTFADGERDSNRRRFIGGKTVCRPCYMFAWEKAKDWRIPIEQALDALPAKGTYKTPSLYSDVTCAMPWCDAVTKDDAIHAITPHAHACGPCCSYLGSIARRYRNHPQHRRKGVIEWGLDAIRGALPAPGTVEQCSMPWCNRVVHPGQREHHGYGPEGEIICNADRTYLYLYAKRKNISFAKAFREAPKPRKHGRPRS